MCVLVCVFNLAPDQSLSMGREKKIVREKRLWVCMLRVIYLFFSIVCEENERRKKRNH